jgi:hypothetical protein
MNSSNAPGLDLVIRMGFHKFLIDRAGNAVARCALNTTPPSLDPRSRSCCRRRREAARAPHAQNSREVREIRTDFAPGGRTAG